MTTVPLPATTQAKLAELYGKGLTPEDIADCMQHLSAFEPNIQTEVLEKFAEVDWSTLKSKAGFLKGIMKRYQARTAPPVTTYIPPSTLPKPTGVAALSAPAQTVLTGLEAIGLLLAGDLEAGVLHALAALDPKVCFWLQVPKTRMHATLKESWVFSRVLWTA